jgi:hypothetical protein
MDGYMGSIDTFHGQNAAMVYSGLNNFLVSHSPRLGKRVYDCLVLMPITFVAKILLCTIEPIEQVATGIIHLLKVPFSEDKTSELKKARDFFLIEFPCLTLCDISRIALSPLVLLVDEVRALKNPESFETSRKNQIDSAKIQTFNEIFQGMANGDNKKVLGTIIEKMRNGVHITVKEAVVGARVYAKHTHDKEILESQRRSREQFFSSFSSDWQDFFPKTSEQFRASGAGQPIFGPVGQVAFRDSALFILQCARKYKLDISRDADLIINNRQSSPEELVKAVDPIRKKLMRMLHPDKTSGLPIDERKKQEEDWKKIAEAWKVIELK